MKYKRLIEQRIFEILDFNNINSVKFSKKSKFDYQFKLNDFIIDVIFDKTELNFDFVEVVPALKNLKDTVTYNIGYSVNDTDGQFEKTNLKVLLPILKTITEIINDFITANKPISLLVFGTNKSGDIEPDSVKGKMYQLMVSKFLPAGYGHSKVKIDSYTGTIIYNIQYSKRGK